MTIATLDGHATTAVRLHVPARGVWYADIDLAEQPEVEGAVVLALGSLELQGTVDPRSSGAHGLQSRVRVLGGGGGWGTLLPAKAYHSDSGVRARLIADDAAREAGETLGDFDVSPASVGIDYVRQSGPAARVLEDAIGASAWWVDYDGLTQVGARPEAEADVGAYELLDYDARARVVTLALDDVAAVGIGSVLTSPRIEAAQSVRELAIELTAGSVSVRAWTGAGASAQGRLLGAIRGIVERVVDGRLFGPWRYRVVQMSADRLELQAVRPSVGLPDVLPVSMWPGVAGAHAEPTPGAEVLVEFIEGDRTMPIVTHFAGKDGEGWAPVNLTFDATTLIKLGLGASEYVALANLTEQRFTQLKTAISTATPVVEDGGAAFKAALLLTLTNLSWPQSVAATKVQAE